jgi:hypothetical protein
MEIDNSLAGVTSGVSFRTLDSVTVKSSIGLCNVVI